MWVYRTTDFVAQRAVLFDFTLGRGGENPRRVLQDFSGTLVSDDFSGYHALAKQGVTPALCMAHARRKLFEVHKRGGSEIVRHVPLPDIALKRHLAVDLEPVHVQLLTKQRLDRLDHPRMPRQPRKRRAAQVRCKVGAYCLAPRSRTL